MVFHGAYDEINGVRRPYITVRVRSADRAWIALPFLIDSGADFPAELAERFTQVMLAVDY
jgi:hypothetical protein